MPYVYLLQPAEFINTNCYKIGMSSLEDLSRLKSYGHGTKYIQCFECIDYIEAEKELLKELNEDTTINLFKGREYFCGNKNTILSIFMKVMLKYVNEEINMDINNLYIETDATEDIIKSEKVVEQKKILKAITNHREELKESTIIDFGNNTSKSCKICSFKCKYDSELNRHLDSKKHKEKTKNKNLCNGCFKEFSTKFSKSRHEQKCSKVIQNITNTEAQNNIFSSQT